MMFLSFLIDNAKVRRIIQTAKEIANYFLEIKTIYGKI